VTTDQDAEIATNLARQARLNPSDASLQASADAQQVAVNNDATAGALLGLDIPEDRALIAIDNQEETD
jgi:hypothetical protein